MATLVWKTASLPIGFLGAPYEAGLAVAMAAAGTLSGVAVSTGSLPPGLTVSTTTDPRIIGTPTASGVFPVKFTANDGGGAVVSGQLSITIYGAPGDEKLTGDFETPTLGAAKRKLN